MTPLVLPLRFSPSLIAALTVVHVLPCVAAFGNGVPNDVRVIVVMLVCVSIVFQCWQGQSRLRMRIELEREGGVFLRIREDRYELELLSGCADLNYLIVLHWRQQESRRIGRCVLTRDGLGADVWRELRIWLRWRSSLQKP